MPFDATPGLPIEAIVIDKALEILGTTGEHWIQCSLLNRGRYCIRGAVISARNQLGIKGDKTEQFIAARLRSRTRTVGFRLTPREIIDRFNDARERRFDQVRDLLLDVRYDIAKTALVAAQQNP